MSRTVNCWDNTVAESFCKSLKAEFIYVNTLINREKIKSEVFNTWNNKNRRHSYLNYMTI